MTEEKATSWIPIKFSRRSVLLESWRSAYILISRKCQDNPQQQLLAIWQVDAGVVSWMERWWRRLGIFRQARSVHCWSSFTLFFYFEHSWQGQLWSTFYWRKLESWCKPPTREITTFFINFVKAPHQRSGFAPNRKIHDPILITKLNILLFSGEKRVLTLASERFCLSEWGEIHDHYWLRLRVGCEWIRCFRCERCIWMGVDIGFVGQVEFFCGRCTSNAASAFPCAAPGLKERFSVHASFLRKNRKKKYWRR